MNKETLEEIFNNEPQKLLPQEMHGNGVPCLVRQFDLDTILKNIEF